MAGPTAAHEDEYGDDLIAMLELVWGEGFLSPGGPEAVRAIIADNDLRGLRVLDIGCGLGGIDVLVAREYGAHVVGVDVEAELVRRARERVAREGLSGQVEIDQVVPGPLEYPDGSFDVVFSKDAWIHIEDKRGLFSDAYRVLKQGGKLLAGDWTRGPDPYSPHMEYFFELEGLTYHMDTLESYGKLLAEAGFVDIELEDITEEYRAQAHAEYEQMRGPWATRMAELLGDDAAAHFVENWRVLTIVLDRGELRPGRLRARRP
jgi:cyclopropane fatty-acyl-phospholipid synthase-like methyltransferase